MKTAITYTTLTLINLIGFVVGISLLPSQVPIHFNASMTADAVGSPWVYLALPAAAAIISAAIWTTNVSKNKKNRAIITGVLAGLGAVLVCVGWVFFALIASGVEAGESVEFPVMTTIVLPLSLFVLFGGNYLPRVEKNFWMGIRTSATLKSEIVWARTQRLAGCLLFGAGLLSAVGAIVFACLPNKLAFVSLIIFLVTVLCAVVASAVYAEVIYRKEKEASKDNE